MANKAKVPEKYQVWINARKRYHLSHAHIQMARELGKTRPGNVKTIEQLAKIQEKNKAERRKCKQLKKQGV